MKYIKTLIIISLLCCIFPLFVIGDPDIIHDEIPIELLAYPIGTSIDAGIFVMNTIKEGLEADCIDFDTPGHRKAFINKANSIISDLQKAQEKEKEQKMKTAIQKIGQLVNHIEWITNNIQKENVKQYLLTAKIFLEYPIINAYSKPLPSLCELVDKGIAIEITLNHLPSCDWEGGIKIIISW